jgi:hypothetical protein
MREKRLRFKAGAAAIGENSILAAGVRGLLRSFSWDIPLSKAYCAMFLSPSRGMQIAKWLWSFRRWSRAIP